MPDSNRTAVSMSVEAIPEKAQKRLVSASLRAVWQKSEYRDNMMAVRGTPEHRIKMRKPKSEGARANMRAAWVLRRLKNTELV